MDKCTSLKDLRLKSGLKAYKIAEELGVTYRQYYRLETGKSKLDKLKEEKLAKIYEVPLYIIKNALGVSNEE